MCSAQLFFSVAAMLTSFSHHCTMAKGRHNNGSKKATDNELDNEGEIVPDLHVKTKAGRRKPASGSATANVDGPFKDLLDLQNNDDQEEDLGADAAEGDDDAPEKAADETAEDGDLEEASAEDNEQDAEDSLSAMAPDDDEDGYLSDDSDEHLEPDSLSSVIAIKVDVREGIGEPVRAGCRPYRICHKGGLRKDGTATRASVYSQKMTAFEKGFVVKPATK
ncbi:unnamed protein product [Closterium sp. Yama58-4]|nr:unnamed protein product [Closterium sp. Yama58-4]